MKIKTHPKPSRIKPCVRSTSAWLLAALGVNAYADSGSSVELYGLVGSYVSSLQRSDMPSRLAQVGSGGMVTSYWGIRGKEDMGNGNSVVFALESFFQPDTGGLGRSTRDPFWSRNAYVGFAGDLGRFTVGRQTNPTYTAMQMVNPFGSSVVFSPVVVQSFVAGYGGTIIGDTVWDNAIQYATPKYQGFSGRVIYGMGEVPGKSSVHNLGLHLSYTSSTLTAVLSAQRVRTAAVAPITGQTTYLAGAAYDFQAVKLYGSLGSTRNAGVDSTSRTYQLGASVPISAQSAILVEWARTQRKGHDVDNTTRQTSSLGIDHFLSKRTDVYAVYSLDKLSTHPRGNTYGVGIRHTF